MSVFNLEHVEFEMSKRVIENSGLVQSKLTGQGKAKSKSPKERKLVEKKFNGGAGPSVRQKGCNAGS